VVYIPLGPHEAFKALREIWTAKGSLEGLERPLEGFEQPLKGLLKTL
jgi:hypothetical protein